MEYKRLSDFIGRCKLISKNGREMTVFMNDISQAVDCPPHITGHIVAVDSVREYPLDNIKRVIFNDPATVVFWNDGTKTVVKCQPGDVYDDEKGLALCIAKKCLGNKSNFNNVFKKYLIRPDEVNYYEDGTPIIGTKIKIIKTCNGCLGAEGKIGIVTNKRHICGLFESDPGYNVECENGSIWRINLDAKIEIEEA